MASLATGIITKVLSDKGVIKELFKKETPLPELPDELALKTAKDVSKWTYQRISVLSGLISFPLSWMENLSKFFNHSLTQEELNKLTPTEKVELYMLTPGYRIFYIPKAISSLVSFTTGVISLFKK